MAFADLQTRVNAAVSAKLMTDVATLDGVAITGKFDASYTSPFGADGTVPSLMVLNAVFAGKKRGALVIINAVRYKVADFGPDDNEANGIRHLLLEKQ